MTIVYQLKEALKNEIATRSTVAKLYDFSKDIGLEPVDNIRESESKREYVERITENTDIDTLLKVTLTLLEASPSYELGTILMDSEFGKIGQISSFTRNDILDEILLLEEGHFNGNLSLLSFLNQVVPLKSLPAKDGRKWIFDAEGDINQHVIANPDWDNNYLLKDYLNLANGPDLLFIRFLELLVHPATRRGEKVEIYVNTINKYLSRDNYQLKAAERVSGYYIYRVVKIKETGVNKKVKNLIFASKGLKPRILLSDSISNDIRVVENEENCLVFDEMIEDQVFLWKDLVLWWSRLNGNVLSGSELEKSLYQRLLASLDSVPEKLFFGTYYRKMLGICKEKLPALIPQVYLHYDPFTIKELMGQQEFVRQRMDFLLLFSNHIRIVIEIDGQQHYSINTRSGAVPSPSKYAEMVAADRQLKLLGYEVYRFGGSELFVDTQGNYQERKNQVEELITDFFSSLFKKYKII